jgi:hypothetical protein
MNVADDSLRGCDRQDSGERSTDNNKTRKFDNINPAPWNPTPEATKSREYAEPKQMNPVSDDTIINRGCFQFRTNEVQLDLSKACELSI